MEAFGAHGKVAYLTLPFGALMRLEVQRRQPFFYRLNFKPWTSHVFVCSFLMDGARPSSDLGARAEANLIAGKRTYHSHQTTAGSRNTPPGRRGTP